jgi:hypothetical protein
MTLYALASPGGAPGVTTAALALALTWPGPVVLAECDPAGGAVLPGLFAAAAAPGPGLLTLAGEVVPSADSITAALASHLRALDDSGQRVLLAGLADPRHAASLPALWPPLAAALASWPADVLADCGRIDEPSPLLAAAERILLVCRPTLRQVAAARPRLAMLHSLPAGASRAAILLTGPGGYTARQVAAALGVPVAATLPADPKTAAYLSDGEGTVRGLATRPLMRAAAAAVRQLTAPASHAALAGVLADKPVTGEMTGS